MTNLQDIIEKAEKEFARQRKFRADYRSAIKHMNFLWDNLETVSKEPGDFTITRNYPFMKRKNILNAFVDAHLFSADTSKKERAIKAQDLLIQINIRHMVIEEMYEVNVGKLFTVKNYNPNQLLELAR